MKTLEELARDCIRAKCDDDCNIDIYYTHSIIAKIIIQTLKQVREQALLEAEKVIERVSLKYTDDITGRAGETIQAIRALREKEES
jgi:predicted RNA-binding protein YlqC (UPF0109 family)